MGIDLIRGGRIANRGNRKTKSSNSYLRSLIKVTIHSFRFILTCPERQTTNSIKSSIKDSINHVLTDILYQSQESSNISPEIETLNIKAMINSKRIVAVVGTVTNDVRLLNVPEGLRVCALKFTQAAKNKITAAKGTCYTFDQLAQIAPTGKGVLLLRGPRDR